MKITINSLIRLKQNREQLGILLPDKKSIAGAQMVKVQLANGQVKWMPFSALELVPSETESLWDQFTNGRFVEPDWLRRTLTRLRVTGRLSEVLYSMEATETDFYAYQFKPVIKLINSPTDAMLVADEVGLGKTIEAGLVWTELRARLDCKRLLVACPKTLCEKWQDELARRFGVTAQIGDAKVLLKALQHTRESGRGYALICSMQGLRPPRGWDAVEPSSGGEINSARRDLARLLSEASDGEPLIDLLVVDEAHHMRNPETMLNHFGRLANSVASHRLFLSATPIHLRNRDLHSLLSMVDQDTFEFESTLNDLIASNAPIVKARDMLLKDGVSKHEVLQCIDDAANHDVLRNSKALTQIRNELKDEDINLDRSKQSELAARLERVNQLSNYVTRTRRRDVLDFHVVRDPKLPMLEMTTEERFFYNEVSIVAGNYALARDANKRFLLSTPQRLLTSSLAAASTYWSGLVDYSSREEVEETDEDLYESLIDEQPLRARIAKRVQELNMTKKLRKVDSKYQLLLREINNIWSISDEEKIVIFSSFKPTLHYLQSRFGADGIVAILLHGSVSTPRAEILARFKKDSTIRILLSSEVGSEGVDLQFSSIIVNYDLPWNPMRLEQRIGRVDRLGQKKQKIMILNLIYENTIDKRVYERLYERLQIGKRALGEMEAILGEPIREMEMKLLDPKLTDKQADEIIDQAALALENRRQVQDKLENEAGALVKHGDYILEKIMESKNKHRWLNDQDILIYVCDRILYDFPGTVIESSPAGSNTYRIGLSQECAVAFQDYLFQKGQLGKTRLLSGNAKQRFRFTSSVVQKEQGVECISQLHPLVRFAAERDLKDETVRNAQAVAAIISMQSFPPNYCEPGCYVLAACRWSSGATGARSGMDARLGFSGANVATGELMEADIAEQMMMNAAEYGRPIPNASQHPQLAHANDTLKSIVRNDLNRRFGEFMNQVTAEVEDRVSIRERSLSQHFEKKLMMLKEDEENLIQQAETAESRGDSRKATNLKNLASAREAKMRKLDLTWRLRKNEIEAQRAATPEEFEVACLLLLVES